MDFLLRRGSEYVAIEVKSGRTAGRDVTRGLRAVTELPGLRRRLLVYGGERRLITPGGVEVLPADAFVALLERGDPFEPPPA